jgi:hypothetical protein
VFNRGVETEGGISREHNKRTLVRTAGQKTFYWAMFYGAFLLLLSGIFMWFPEYAPRMLRPWMIIVHEGAPLITMFSWFPVASTPWCMGPFRKIGHDISRNLDPDVSKLAAWFPRLQALPPNLLLSEPSTDEAKFFWRVLM